MYMSRYAHNMKSGSRLALYLCIVDPHGPEFTGRSPCETAESPGEMGWVLISEGIGDIDHFQIGAFQHLRRNLKACIFDELGICQTCSREITLQGPDTGVHGPG